MQRSADLLLLQMRGIKQYQAGEFARRGGRYDLAVKSFFRKLRQATAVVEVSVRQQHKIDFRRIESEWISVLRSTVLRPLMQAAVNEHAMTITFKQMARTSDVAV